MAVVDYLWASAEVQEEAAVQQRAHRQVRTTKKPRQRVPVAEKGYLAQKRKEVSADGTADVIPGQLVE